MKRIPTTYSILLLLMIAALFAQDTGRPRPKGLLEGRIRLPSGEQRAPEMIRATLSSLTGNLLQRRTLTGELSFTFTDVNTGHYTVTLESPGYQTVQQTVEMQANITGDRYFVTVMLGRPLPEGDLAVPKSSEKTVSAAALLIPQKARKELEKANRERAENNPQKAIKHLQKALEIYPELYQAYNNLAVEYVGLGRTTEAIESLQQSISLNPDDATTHRNLAQLYLGQGSYGKALVPLKRSLELDPQDSKGPMLLGEAYLGMGQYQLALNYFHSAARENPQDRSYLGIGQCYLQLGLHEEALREFKGFIAQEPKDPR
ncbi:tetratricopeptide repeat protein, partial [Acidobacteria bacterium AH-259-L09]|nr:tetratricopeptide repeat protein [Acidobacteria bacterium AH-259-L09]